MVDRRAVAAERLILSEQYRILAERREKSQKKEWEGRGGLCCAQIEHNARSA